jgi:hypothetical protein
MLRDSGIEVDLALGHLETTNNLQIQSDQIFKEHIIRLLQSQIDSPVINDDFFVYLQVNPKRDFPSFLESISRCITTLVNLPNHMDLFSGSDLITLFQMFSVEIMSWNHLKSKLVIKNLR